MGGFYQKQTFIISGDTRKFGFKFRKKQTFNFFDKNFMLPYLKKFESKVCLTFGLTYFRGFAVVSQQSKVKSDFQPSDTTGSALKFEFFRKRQIKGKCLPQHKNTVNSLQNQCQTRQWQNWLESGKLLARNSQVPSMSFIHISSRFYPNLIQILSRFNPDFFRILSRFCPQVLETLFNQILSWIYLYFWKNWRKSHRIKYGWKDMDGLSGNGYDKAWVVLGQFLVMKNSKNSELFVDWIKNFAGANSKQASDCYQCLSDWCDKNLGCENL
jgi:hypothetical protein